MYLMYVDEAGDPGLVGSPSEIYVLEGLVVHELRWQDCLSEMVDFRRWVRQQYGVKLREELHASRLITRPGSLARIPKYQRLAIIGAFANTLARISDFNLISIVVDKTTKNAGYDVFEMAWKALVMRLENTISYRNFRGPANPDDRGIVLSDNTDNRKLLRLLSGMRRHNPVPNQPQVGSGYRNLPLASVIERPTFRDSRESYFIQACDLAAFLLYQELRPNRYMRTKGGKSYFNRLSPIFCTAASSKDPRGIVWL